MPDLKYTALQPNSCGPQSVATLGDDGYALHFIIEAYKHFKTVRAFGAGSDLLRKARIGEPLADGQDIVATAGIVSTAAAEDSMPTEFFESFASALARHRAWDRQTDSVPA